MEKYSTSVTSFLVKPTISLLPGFSSTAPTKACNRRTRGQRRTRAQPVYMCAPVHAGVRGRCAQGRHCMPAACTRLTAGGVRVHAGLKEETEVSQESCGVTPLGMPLRVRRRVCAAIALGRCGGCSQPPPPTPPACPPFRPCAPLQACVPLGACPTHAAGADAQNDITLQNHETGSLSTADGIRTPAAPANHELGVETWPLFPRLHCAVQPRHSALHLRSLQTLVSQRWG